MTKLQPNFSWQKYEGTPENKENQFQYQLQQQHNLVSNALNSTIDDISYFTRERPTGETWIDNQQIYTRTFQFLVSASPYTHGISPLINVIDISGTVQDTVPLTAFAYPLCYTDPNVLANGIGVFVTPTQIIIVTNGAGYNTYTARVTLKYTKKRG